MGEYLSLLWEVVLRSLRLDQTVFQDATTGEWSIFIPFSIAFVGGVSLLLGQSVILFANRVRPPRFLASLLLNGVLYVGSLVVWAGAIRWAGWLIARERIPPDEIISIMMLTAAPMVFGFLILIPYLGPLINRVLNIWSFLIAYQIIMFRYETMGRWQPWIIVGIGWLFTILINNTIGWPIISISQRIRNWVAGADLNRSTNELLATYAERLLPNPHEIEALGMAHSKKHDVNEHYAG